MSLQVRVETGGQMFREGQVNLPERKGVTNVYRC